MEIIVYGNNYIKKRKRENKMNDLISRQAAIDTAIEAVDSWDGGCNIGRQKRIENYIKRLPSAQPEIIRCKDCKHWIPYDWMFSEIWQSKNMVDYPENEIGCECCDMSMKANDFCSRAERREVAK